MDWPAWEPLYEEILRDFGYARAADEAARDELDALLEDHLAARLPDFAGEEVVILGGAPYGKIPRGPLVVADPRALPPRSPDLIVTDLDGDIGLQLALNVLGAPLVVHAHGDNVAALRAHVPKMRGPVAGSTQAAPTGPVRNWGGFTDGDRAACLAVALGASSLALAGFDYETPAPKSGRDADTKRRKLAWARRIIDGLPVSTRRVGQATGL